MAATDLRRIAQAYGIRLVLQFGSSVTGRLPPGSDLDVPVLDLNDPEAIAGFIAGFLSGYERNP